MDTDIRSSWSHLGLLIVKSVALLLSFPLAAFAAGALAGCLEHHINIHPFQGVDFGLGVLIFGLCYSPFLLTDAGGRVFRFHGEQPQEITFLYGMLCALFAGILAYLVYAMGTGWSVWTLLWIIPAALMAASLALIM